MNEDEINARLEEIQAEVDEYYQIEAAIAFAADLAYWRDEGFIELETDEDGSVRIYPKEEACYLNVPPAKP